MTKPKFKIGDKVILLDGVVNVAVLSHQINEIGTINECITYNTLDQDNRYSYKLSTDFTEYGWLIPEEYLKPYRVPGEQLLLWE